MKRKLIIWVLVSVVALLTITACAQEPPPDVPLYAEGEAIAIVKTQVRAEVESEWVAHLKRRVGEQSDWRRHRERLKAKAAADEYVDRACWTEEYLGQGKWVVTRGYTPDYVRDLIEELRRLRGNERLARIEALPMDVRREVASLLRAGTVERSDIRIWYVFEFSGTVEELLR